MSVATRIPSGSPNSPAAAAGEKRKRVQLAAITAGALLLYVIVRQLPTGTNLSHLDFRVEGGTSIEFCDPTNPQFIPVVAVPSPVSMSLQVHGPAPRIGHAVSATATLATSTGKSIGPEDLLITHTQKLHLLIFDPSARHYEHVHPVAGARAGDWDFAFTPKTGGTYRIFADFTPSATARGLYANADLAVSSEGADAVGAAAQSDRDLHVNATSVEQEGFIFQLTPAAQPIRANLVTDFEFTASRKDGRPTKLEPVMDAYAHLVAVDEQRSGFAHLHPAQLVDPKSEGATFSKLNFKVTIPRAGRYVIWAQVKIEGTERYIPFWFDVI
ncbi:MAG TPA: hypothetical protein VFT72_10135 [Opitutaceae bacterium]|nr:hypothetical protein [Opitutaceae bacterium]